MKSQDQEHFSIDIEQQAYQEQLLAQSEILDTLQHRILSLQQQNSILEDELMNSAYTEKNSDYETYFKLSPVHLVIIDGHGIIRDLNESAIEFFHSKRESIEGASLRSLLTKSSFRDFTKNFANFKESDDTDAYIYFLQLKNLHQFTLILRKLSPIHDNRSMSIICSIVTLDSTTSEYSDYLSKIAIDQMHEGITVTDEHGTILRVNNAFTEISGYSRDEVIGKNPNILKSGRHSKGFYDRMWDEIRHHGWWSGEIWNRRKNAQIYPQWLQINRIMDPISRKLYYISTFSDITERKKNQEKLDQLAHYDALTGLMNRHFMKISLQNLIDRQRDSKSIFAVLFIDLDHFKQINDRYGHHIGDLVLQESSQRILGAIRQNDYVGRIGGDEFVVLLTRLEKIEDALRVAEKIVKKISLPYNVNTKTHHISASIGVAQYPLHGDSVEDLMRRADTAMYRAKNSGRARVSLFDDEDEKALISHEHIKALIRKAIEFPQQHLKLHYQPVINALTHDVVSLEALVRLIDDNDAIISPICFIETAETENMIGALGEQIFTKVCRFIEENDKKAITTPPIAINLSVLQLSNDTLFETFENIAKAHNLSIERFSFEVTETHAMQSMNTILHTMHQFRNAGCKIMLDDFGTGYASLSELYQLPVDTIKIDKSFTDRIEDHHESHQNLIRAILSMAGALKLDIIVEGVENEKQLEWLKDQGAIKIQGYVYSKPLDGEQLRAQFLT
jgi:diguanylate cyclase (GGDEF)-like protein/PAS domain S-box-containing protein